MTMSSVRDSVLMVLLAIAAIASLSDMRDDLAHGSDALHLVGEGAVLTLVGVALAWLLRERGRQHRELAHLRAELDEAGQRAAAADGADVVGYMDMLLVFFFSKPQKTPFIILFKVFLGMRCVRHLVHSSKHPGQENIITLAFS